MLTATEQVMCLEPVPAEGFPGATDLSYCASGGVFGEIIVDFCHCPFYGIHHLKR